MTGCKLAGMFLFILSAFIYGGGCRTDMVGLVQDSVFFLGSCIWIAGFMSCGKND